MSAATLADPLAPADEAGFVAAIVVAHEAREPLLVGGRGSKAGLLRPVQAARSLSSRNHAGITLYSPQEMIISARAGTPLAEVEQAVAARGQHIVFEPPDLSAVFGGPAEQTLGGVVATNLSGPRRVAWGAARDHVMGVRAVNGAGELIHSGGRVLKNVTGLDLCKLLTGSHGTLAVLTEITLKLLPAPEATGTILLPGLTPEAGVAALSAALGSPYGVSGAAYLPAQAAACVPGLSSVAAALVRLEEFATSVAYRSERLRGELAGFAEAELLDDAASRVVWRAVRDAAPVAGAEAVWRVSVRPSAGPAVVRALAGRDLRWFMDWGGGLVWLAGSGDADTHAAVCAAATSARGAWTLLHGPEPLRAAVAVVPPEPEPLARITRRVKAAMDPHGVLNPGRIYAGL